MGLGNSRYFGFLAISKFWVGARHSEFRDFQVCVEFRASGGCLGLREGVFCYFQGGVGLEEGFGYDIRFPDFPRFSGMCRVRTGV